MGPMGTIFLTTFDSIQRLKSQKNAKFNIHTLGSEHEYINIAKS